MTYSRRGGDLPDTYAHEKRRLLVVIGGKVAGHISEYANRFRSFTHRADYDGVNVSWRRS